MPFGVIFQVVLFPQGELLGCMLRQEGNLGQQKEGGLRWLYWKPLGWPHNTPKSCPGWSVYSNQVPDNNNDQSRWEWELWSTPCGMSLLIFTDACLLNRVELRKNRASCRRKTKRESEPLIKDKGDLSYSALYSDLNLLQARPTRYTSPNWWEYHAVSNMGFEKSWAMTPFLMTLQDILRWSSHWHQLLLHLLLFTAGCSAWRNGLLSTLFQYSGHFYIAVVPKAFYRGI